MLVDGPLLCAERSRDLGFDAKALFARRYPIIKKALECHRAQGLLILAFDDQETALGQAWLAASLDRTRVAILGRHGMCGVAVTERHPAVSLRHLAVLVRAISHSEVRVRILDLHTRIGFSDEAGRVLQAVTCEGSLFLDVGGVKLALLVTDDGPLADDPAAQYACIPDRVFLEERRGTASDPEPRQAGAPDDGGPSISVVRSMPGPLAAAGPLCGDGDRPVGTLIVRSSAGVVRRSVGAAVLARGLLVGRYARCDVGVTGHQESQLSRVHLLIIRDGDHLLAVDTASINGTHVGGRAILAYRLEDGTTLDLGGELQLVWHQEG